MADRTHDEHPLRFLSIVDEYTPECHALDVECRMNHEHALDRLKDLFIMHGAPSYTRSDNGSEFTAEAVRELLERLGVKTLYIEPANPWENDYIESFNGKFRDEALNGERFDTLLEAKVLTEKSRIEYSTIGLYSSPGHNPPTPEAIFPRSSGAQKETYAYGLT